MYKQILSITIPTLVFCLADVSATAGVLTYTALIDWQTAGPPAADTITFEGLTIPSSSTAYAVGPITFSTGDPLHFLSLFNTGFGPGSGNFLVNASPTYFTPDSTVFGIGFNFRCYGCDPSTATISVTNSFGVTTFSATTVSPGLSNFIGVRSDSAIQSLVISFNGVNPFVAVDNVAYAGADAPEAATLILMGTGLAFIARYRRYASHRPAAA